MNGELIPCCDICKHCSESDYEQDICVCEITLDENSLDDVCENFEF